MNITPTLKKYGLPNLPYALIFWFSNKLGMAYRTAGGGDFLKKLVNSMTTLNKAISNPLPTGIS